MERNGELGKPYAQVYRLPYPAIRHITEEGKAIALSPVEILPILPS